MSSPVTLDPDAVLWSVPPSEAAAALASRPLLVLMHGRGSDERDLFSLAPELPPALVLASVRAPLPEGGGFSWFPSGDLPAQPSSTSADAAARSVLDWLDTIPTSGPIGLLGFSQGGGMATHLLRHDPERFGSAVSLAGFSVRGELVGDARLAVIRPPVFWGRDPADPAIPAAAIDVTTEWLPTHSTLTARLYDGIGHSIGREELDDVIEFLGETLLTSD